MYLTKPIRYAYKNIIKPLAFRQDAEHVHNNISRLGEFLGSSKVAKDVTSKIFSYSNEALHKKVLGIEFKNPIGLAAGFDYDGHLAEFLPSIGFGFNTVGTVTAQPYEGNAYPRLGRLPKSKSLLVNKGFKSEGASAVAKRLDNKDFRHHGTLGLSVGSTNIPQIDTPTKAIDDYLTTFNVFKDKDYVKYFELNISCPNISLKGIFTDENFISELAHAVNSLNLTKPIFVKMHNEISHEKSDALVKVFLKFSISGFIFSNLVKDRANKFLNREEVESIKDLKGNFSGKPCFDNSNSLIRHTRSEFANDVSIVGCGGVFSAKDAKAKLNAGADLVQLITGTVYEGPQLVGEINKSLSNIFNHNL